MARSTKREETKVEEKEIEAVAPSVLEDFDVEYDYTDTKTAQRTDDGFVVTTEGVGKEMGIGAYSEDFKSGKMRSESPEPETPIHLDIKTKLPKSVYLNMEDANRNFHALFEHFLGEDITARLQIQANGSNVALPAYFRQKLLVALHQGHLACNEAQGKRNADDELPSYPDNRKLLDFVGQENYERILDVCRAAGKPNKEGFKAMVKHGLDARAI